MICTSEAVTENRAIIIQVISELLTIVSFWPVFSDLASDSYLTFGIGIEKDREDDQKYTRHDLGALVTEGTTVTFSAKHKNGSSFQLSSGQC